MFRKKSKKYANRGIYDVEWYGMTVACVYQYAILFQTPFMRMMTWVYIIIQLQSFEAMQQVFGRSNKKSSKEHRRLYDKISSATRKQLIELVLEHGISIYRASKLIGINNATAKVIVKRFKETGTYFQRKSEGADEQQESNQGQVKRKTRTQQISNHQAKVGLNDADCFSSEVVQPIQPFLWNYSLPCLPYYFFSPVFPQ